MGRERARSRARRHVLLAAGLILLSSISVISLHAGPSGADTAGRQGETGVWTSSRLWADANLLYDAEVGDIWPGHPGDEIIVGGESNWTTLIYGHEDSWEAERLFSEAWYITNIAIGDVDPDEPGNETVNVGYHGNVSMVYWEDSTNKWRHVELVHGLSAGLDWCYGVAIGDFDPRYAGNEVAVTDDMGRLVLVRKDGNGWAHEVIWQDGGAGIIDPYLDTVLLNDFDPGHDGKEIVVTGGSKYVTELYWNGSGWTVERLWRGKMSSVQLAVGDFLPDLDGNEIGVVGLDNNMTVLHWNGTDWVDEHVYTDMDVIYDIDIGGLLAGNGTQAITGGWSQKVVVHEARGDPHTWTSETVHEDEDFVFGVTIGDFDDLHAGNEVVVVDRAGEVTKLQHETPDFVLHCPSPATSILAGMSGTFDILVYSRAGFKEEVTFEVKGQPASWTVAFSEESVVPGSSYTVLEVTVPIEQLQGDVRLTVTGKSASKEHSIDLWVHVLPPSEKDYTMETKPSSQTVVADYSVKYTIVVGSLNGFSDQVALSVSGLPDGATATLTADTVAPPGSVTLEVRTTATTIRGTHFIVVTGTSGELEHAVTVTLTVLDSNSPDFSLALAPATIQAVGSVPAQVKVNVLSLYGFSQPVSLSVDVGPAIAHNFTPGTVTPAGSSSLNLTFDASLPRGTYYFEVVGKAGSITHIATLTVRLNEASDPDFSILAFPDEVNVTASLAISVNVTVSPEDDFAAAVTLSVEGLPVDTVATFSPQSLFPYEYSSLEIRTLVSTPAGDHSFEVVGRGSGLERRLTVDLRVLPARPVMNLIRMEGPNSGLRDGEVAKVQAWVENIGLINGTDVGIELVVDDKVVDSGNITLSPGSGDVVDLRWKAWKGEHELKVRIVPGKGHDIETGEISRTVEVSAPETVEGFWTWIMMAIAVIIVIVIVLGVLMLRGGEAEGVEKGGKGEKGRRRKKGSKKRGQGGKKGKGGGKVRK